MLKNGHFDQRDGEISVTKYVNIGIFGKLQYPCYNLQEKLLYLAP